VLHAVVNPHWSTDGNSFWYETDDPHGQRQTWQVDAVAGTRQAISATDRGALAAGSSSLPNIGRPHRSVDGGRETTLTFVNATEAPVTLFWINTAGERVRYPEVPAGERYDEHTYVGHVWLVADTNGQTLGVYEAADNGGEAIIDPTKTDTSPATTQPTGATRPATTAAAASGNRRRRRGGGVGNSASPDGKWLAYVESDNVYVRNRADGRSVQLSQDGKPSDGYDASSLSWSPDSTHLVALRTLDGEHRTVYEVQSSPPDQEQPRLLSFEYAKPGDRIAITKPHLFDVVAGREIKIDDALFPNPWEGRDNELRWDTDSRRFTFYYNQRGHQVARVIAVDADTGKATAIVNEEAKTFIDYSGKHFLRFVSDDELVWMSERDGWNHLFLYDTRTGQVKNTITQGNWVVRSVDRIDTEKRQVWFQAGGLDPKQDPYYIHSCRVNLDGNSLLDLTPGDGTHKVQFSPDGRFYIDTYSRVDLPPVNELRRSGDGELVCPLERADAGELLAVGWRYPERFVAKGRDGTTDIYGIIIRPTNFDPNKKYPVIEDIYAGPQDNFVPKAFTRRTYSMGLAELGFIVVHIDGMGTSNRSKAFHDVCWRNLGDAGFPDRILWIQAAAKAHPEMDLGKGVGIYGTSAGGQSALRAVEAHGDFYTAAVADCGCHDNRMDKIWWNEQWMGWPIGPWYAEQSNVTNAKDLKGALLLIVGETDHNVDPASTMQVVNALIKANKDFDLLVIPNADHGQDGRYGDRRRKDFFVRHLLGVEPPSHN
jgi:dipeptidyl aminopeptidase/acylaminoacyl peptidase